jgi:hypothetical protein
MARTLSLSLAPAWPAEGRAFVITSKPIARRDGSIRYAASLMDSANRISIHTCGDTEDEAQQAARDLYVRTRDGNNG